MIPGIVSNCWRTQLERGDPLDVLVEQAVGLEFRAVELRQTCLGGYECEDGTPRADLLAELPLRFPNVKFNLALAFPFLDAAACHDEPLYEAGIRAAEAVSGNGPVHLRLVDLKTRDDQVPRDDRDGIARNIVSLVEPLADRDGLLSLENAGQSWGTLKAVMDRAWELLGGKAKHLRLCYDPANLLNAADRPDTQPVSGSLTAEQLSMVHFKQFHGRQLLPTVCEGDLNWPAQLDRLREIAFDGSALFEIAPHEDIWENLQASRDYLENLARGSIR